MANPEQVSSFPLPPTQYFNAYTDENIKKNRAPKPPPCPGETYQVNFLISHFALCLINYLLVQMFGNVFDTTEAIIRPLESQGIKRLYPQHFDRKKELKKLNHSLLANFLDLIDLLINSPDSPRRTEKIDDLTLLFVHIHHLLNEYRPHQARETLRVMLDLQKRQRLETVKRFNFHYDTVKEIVKASFQGLPDEFVVSLNMQEIMKFCSTDGDNNTDQDSLADQMLADIITSDVEMDEN
jgi:mediator of RNA polymerase II transcription subunit 7